MRTFTQFNLNQTIRFFMLGAVLTVFDSAASFAACSATGKINVSTLTCTDRKDQISCNGANDTRPLSSCVCTCTAPCTGTFEKMGGYEYDICIWKLAPKGGVGSCTLEAAKIIPADKQRCTDYCSSNATSKAPGKPAGCKEMKSIKPAMNP